MKIRSITGALILWCNLNVTAQIGDSIMSLGIIHLDYDSISETDTLAIDYQIVYCTSFYSNSELIVRKCLHTNGKISSETQYEKGERNGVETTWYRSGNIAYQQTWEDGELQGTHRTWYADGKLKKEGLFSNGVGTMKEFFKGGEIKKIQSITNSYYLKSVEEYFKNGQLKCRIEFPQKNEKYIEYHDDGTIRVIGKYVNGQKDSTWTFFNREGEIDYTREFRDGLLINN